jgi:hypothetical protein
LTHEIGLIPNIVFISLKYFFLVILYLFIFLVIRAIYRDVASPAAEAASPRGSRRKKREPHPQLVVVAGDRNLGARYDLPDDLLIGRAQGSSIVLEDTYASQQHARVYSQGDSFCVEDLGSTNGTYVNGRKISYPLELRPGDRIKIGKTVFEFYV